jgi:hypothetical protein
MLPPRPAAAEVSVRSYPFAIIMGAIGLVAGSDAPAQTEYSAKDTRRITYDYAKCVVGRHPATASEALLSNVDNGTIAQRYSALIDGECLVRYTHANSKMKFEGDLYRYALADALVSREFAAAPVPNFSDLPPLAYRPLPDEPAPITPNSSKSAKRRYEQAMKDIEQARAFRALSEFGECVVRSSPAAAKALLLTEPETAAEASGFNALRTSLGLCLPEGRTLAFGKLVLRGTIAVSYYRLAHAAVPSATR